MAQPPSAPRPVARRRKPLNLTRIKSVIVFCVGAITALGSALTGLGAHAAFAPMLNWMLGFAAEKAQATALRYAAYAAFAAVIGAFVMKVMPYTFVAQGSILTFGAIFGAILAAPYAVKPENASQRRVFQTVGIAIGLFVILRTARLTVLEVPYFAKWDSLWQLAVLGTLVGVLTQVLGLVSGALLVPTLTFLAGFGAKQAVILSLIVVALASALPAWTYVKRGVADTTYGNWAVLGGLGGGFAGGLLLGRLAENAVLYLFALVVMFLSARELARTA